jgi:hypothetical protein
MRMDRNQMEELADIIVSKLMEKQREFDREFIEEIEMSNIPLEIHEKLSEKDKVLMNIASLVIKMEDFIEREEYDKAQSCKEKIRILKESLNQF